jgi:hypothetical protein
MAGPRPIYGKAMPGKTIRKTPSGIDEIPDGALREKDRELSST